MAATASVGIMPTLMAAPRARSRSLLVVALVAVLFTWTEAAWAQVPDDVAAVDQYRETIPTGAGGTGVGSGTGDAGRLSAGTRADLAEEAGKFASTLEA